MSEENIIEQRKNKFFGFLKNSKVWVIGLLIIAIILGVYIRSMPMQDHGGTPGLWDVTTNDWTLGPDLDPWLFTRQAKVIIEQGSLPVIDYMRFVPVGFNNADETRLLPYLIAWTYQLVNIFGDYSINFAAAVFPVIMFVLTIISFFLFTREIFLRKDKKTALKANLISIIASFFMIVIPVFLSRTIAGIPEKESAAFFFMFLAFYLFLKAWKAEKLRNSIILASLTGVTTALMGLISGTVVYVFVAIGIATLIAFILNKVSKKESLVYCLWIIFSMIFLSLFSGTFSFATYTSVRYLIGVLVLFIIIVHNILWKTKLNNTFEKYSKRLPRNLVSIIVAIILGCILLSIFFGIHFIPQRVSGIIDTFIKPITGRWAQTVAENRQPYFTEWASSFGPFINNVPILFWLFFVGSVVLFREMLKPLLKKDAWILTGLYVFFFFGLVFSRYAEHPAILDGEGFVSRLFYFGSAILLIGSLIYYYTKYHKQGLKSFEEIDYEYLFFFAIFILTLFTARSAVRLIMVLGPISVILLAYLIITSLLNFKGIKEDLNKTLLGAVILVILILSIFTFVSFYNEIKSSAYSYVPSSYNQQWQLAMKWVREQTPKQAVFAHWWDYGYWVQSIGERATVLDGGNPYAYWNYLMGRLVLTGDNQDDALEFLYNHNATHLLIDSSDIGKYGAFSSIGSNEEYDRYSWMGAFVLDETQTQETNNQTILVYPGGLALDEDLIVKQNGKEILLPGGSAGVGAIIVPTQINGNETSFDQPYIIAVYQSQQYRVNVRYLTIDGKTVDFESGIDADVYIFPSLIVQGSGVSSNQIGAAMYLSPRLVRGMLTQVYILNDPFNNFPNFKPIYSEPSPIVKQLNSQGMNLPEFIYYQGIQGPIKIWEIEYTGKEEIKQEYLDVDSSKYLAWQL
ncbi:MAG: STT3 domain-containing protein [Candidatus Pacearchaeota archaeon]|jgi:asparagine N-glycosylation enzyme membrane subunit Stt3